MDYFKQVRRIKKHISNESTAHGGKKAKVKEE